MYNKSIKRGGYSRRLRNACRKAFAAVASALVLGAASFAQVYPNGLAMDSVRPDLDSTAFDAIRAHLDSVRTACGRPTVALVLSGGGAKGAAQTSVLKYLEDRGVPIDLICGTSIGGLVGGLYSVGYRADDIAALFRDSDWSVMLTDKVDSEYYSYERRLRKSTFALSVPFHYRSGDAALRGGSEHADFGSSLPSGYVYGLNVNNLLSSMTVGYHDSLSFVNLPVPFVCVASDLVSCKAYNFSGGDLKTAMRSTMSVPGLFGPVRKDGMVLVDGGTRNNFPVDIAAAAGADYIIAVDLSTDNSTQYDFNNVGDVLMQFFTMLGADSYEKNRDKADVTVKPDLQGYNMLSFRRDAIDSMFVRGSRAASASSVPVDSIMAALEGSRPSAGESRAVDIRERKVKIGGIRFDGVSPDEEKYLLWMTGLKEGQDVDAGDMRRAMSLIHATGCFEFLSYSLEGRCEPYCLVFNCRRGPVHQLGFGLRADTGEWVSLAVNVGLNKLRLSGSEFEATARVGVNQSLDARYSLEFPSAPAFNVAAGIANHTGATEGSIPYWMHTESVYMSNPEWKTLGIDVGLRNRHYGLLGADRTTGDWLGAFARLGMLTMDDICFPTHGIRLDASYGCDFLSSGHVGFAPVHMVAAGIRGAVPVGERFAFIPELNLRGVFNAGAGSVLHSNYYGGNLPGRCMSQQLAYLGSDGLRSAADNLAIAGLDFRTMVVKNLYVSVLGAFLREAETAGGMFDASGRSDYAVGIEAAYRTVAGPMKLNFHWSQAEKFGFFVSLGFDF